MENSNSDFLMAPNNLNNIIEDQEAIKRRKKRQEAVNKCRANTKEKERQTKEKIIFFKEKNLKLEGMIKQQEQEYQNFREMALKIENLTEDEKRMLLAEENLSDSFDKIDEI